MHIIFLFNNLEILQLKQVGVHNEEALCSLCYYIAAGMFNCNDMFSGLLKMLYIIIVMVTEQG